MSVIDVRIRDHVHQFARFQIRHLGHHHEQHRVLHHVPVVRREDVLRPLVEDAVERVALHVECHRVCARLEPHVREVLEVVQIRQDAPAVPVILEAPEDVVHLVHLALPEPVFLSHLVAVGLSDGSLFIGPLVPHVALQISQPVGLLLPYPQHLVCRQLDGGRTQRERRELLRKIVAVHHAEVLDGVRRRAVFPVRTHRHPLGAETVVEDVLAHIHEKLICSAH